MALEVVLLLTGLVILATVCVRVIKGILGDTVLFSRGPRDFLLDRLARCGDPFTISLMGRKKMVISSPESIKFVLSTAHASFLDAYPVQIIRLLDRHKFVDARRHSHFRKIMLSAATGDRLQKLVPFISSLAEKTVKSWESQAVVNSVEELEKRKVSAVCVQCGNMHIIWRDVEPDPKEMDEIRNETSYIGEGLTVLPFNFPGFGFHKAMKAKQPLVSRVQSEVSKRRKAGIQQDDILSTLMSIREVDVPDYDVSCIASSTMFAASETSAALISWVLKYLDDFPEVRQLVQDEQDSLQQKMIEDKSLSWFKTKTNMPYTPQVIYEVLQIDFFYYISTASQ